MKAVIKAFGNRFIIPATASAVNTQGTFCKGGGRKNVTCKALNVLLQVPSGCLRWGSHCFCLLSHMEPLSALFIHPFCHAVPWQLTSLLPRCLRREDLIFLKKEHKIEILETHFHSRHSGCFDVGSFGYKRSQLFG